MKLTEHFSFEELSASSEAVRLGIDNTPPDSLISNGLLLADGMERIRRVLGVAMHVLSGYRCEALERVLTAKDFANWCVLHSKDPAFAWPEYFARKAHPKFIASDFIAPQFGTPTEIVKVVRASGIPFDQLIVEGVTPSGKGWVHASFDRRLRGEVLIATFDNGRPTYSPA